MSLILCPVCKSNDFRIIYRSNLTGDAHEVKTKEFTYGANVKQNGQIVRCKECNLIYVNPQEENIKELYEQTEDEIYELSKESRMAGFKKDMESIGIGKLLDVGCSTGIFLEVAKEKGLDVYGIELSKWSYKKSKIITGNVYNKELEKCMFKNNFFDIVTMWDVLEHLTDPNIELKEIHRILKKDGNLIITTPNINSFFSRLTKRNWWAIMRMHLFYFSPNTITKLLNNNKFNVIQIKSYSRTIMLKYSIEWLKSYKYLYNILKLIVKSKLGRFKIRVNTGDTMIVYAKKIYSK